MPKQTMGEFMATLRKANGYTQQEVSDKLNISNRTLSSWETDRTLPDVLMLPAIADLYGVTVDELLRGERNNINDNSRNDISENSLKSVYKNRFGTFAVKNALLLGIALICAALFVVACALSLWSAAPAWLDWTMLILGAVGLCACIAVLVYLYSFTKLSVGVVTDEDLTDDKKTFVTAMRHKLESFFPMCALPFALFALCTLIYFAAADPQNEDIMGVININVRYWYKLFIILNFALAVILFGTYWILKAITVKNYYSDTQKSTAKLNRKLVGKLAIFGSIPIAVVIAFNIVLTVIVWAPNRTTLYKCDDLEEFKTHLQTLVIEEEDTPYNPYRGVPAGEYYLAFPEGDLSQYYDYYETEYDIGNGFYAIVGFSTYNIDGVINTLVEYHWLVTYGSSITDEENWHNLPTVDSEDYVWVGTFNVITVDNTYVTNVRYRFEENAFFYDSFDNKIELNAYTTYLDGQYCFVTYNSVGEISTSFSTLMICTLTIVPIATVIACSITYAIKRKKQKYNF